MSDDWSDAELAAAVDAYDEMSRLEALQKPYSKKAFYRTLAGKYSRSEKAFEFRMQNISAVRDELKMGWIPGLKPAKNVGTNVRPRLVMLIERPVKPNSSTAVPAPYKTKLPAIREWLIAVARSNGKVTYADVMEAFGIDRFSLRHAMDFLGHQADNLDEPIITALIVSKGTQHCSPGLEKEFGVKDDDAERQKLYDHWQSAIDGAPPAIPSSSMDARAARFASVEIRPSQASFRRLVFLAYGGTCAISGCNVDKVLDAAHLEGRDWRQGHNTAKDGILLRKDLHALYDSKLLKVTSDGFVVCNLEHYKHLHGQSVKSK